MLNAQWNAISADMISEDEIDDLFNQLDQLEPPPYLISRVLTAVSLLPQPQPLPTSRQWSDLDTLIVWDIKKNRC